MTYQELNQELGNLDIYLLDAILKGRFSPGMRILDAGCGEGRNLHWFIRNHFDAWGCDSNPAAIKMLQYVARSLDPKFDKNRFITAAVEELPYPDEMFDATICNAVLHFSANEDHFKKMWGQLYRSLKTGGMLFVRTASVFGLESSAEELEDGKYMLPDGSIRFLLSQALLDELLANYSFRLLEPVKTVLVQNARSMTTLVLEKANNSEAD